MEEKIEIIRDVEAVDFTILREMHERMMREVEHVMFGGCLPPPPTTLRLGGRRCPDCGPVLVCPRHMRA